MGKFYTAKQTIEKKWKKWISLVSCLTLTARLGQNNIGIFENNDKEKKQTMNI